MATVRNKKSQPLSEEEVKKLFASTGIVIDECDDGICLVGARHPQYDDSPIWFSLNHSANAERCWANLQRLFKGMFLSKSADANTLEDLEFKVNTELFGRTPKIRFTLR